MVQALSNNANRLLNNNLMVYLVLYSGLGELGHLDMECAEMEHKDFERRLDSSETSVQAKVALVLIRCL